VPRRFVTYECFWTGVVVVGTVTSHNLYVVVFSHLLGLSVFKAYVRTVKTFHFLNYLWVASLLASLVCLISGIAKASTIHTDDPYYIPSIF
jgi:hypothetical protein